MILDLRLEVGHSIFQEILKIFKLLSIDLKEMEEIDNTYQIIGDFTANKHKKKLKIILNQNRCCSFRHVTKHNWQ